MNCICCHLTEFMVLKMLENSVSSIKPHTSITDGLGQCLSNTLQEDSHPFDHYLFLGWMMVYAMLGGASLSILIRRQKHSEMAQTVAVLIFISSFTRTLS